MIPGLKFMDGTPVPEEYQRAIAKLVDEAAEAEERIPIDELEQAAQKWRTP